MKFTRWGNAIAVTAALLARADIPSTAPDEEDIVITSRDNLSEVEFDPAGTATARNGVVVKWKGSIVLAQKIQIDRETAQADAEGDVEIEYLDRQGHHQLWRGGKIHYNFDSKSLDAMQFRLGRPPIYVGGSGLSGSGLAGGTQTATNAVITTEDLSTPGYKIKARRIVIDSAHRLKADDAVMYIGRVPVMYFPHYSRSFEGNPNFWTITPGYRSLWGPFLLTAYHWNVRTNLELVFDMDYRQRRGPGVGPEAHYDAGDFGKGMGRFYYLRDESPNLSGFPQPIDRDRYRYDFKHSLTNDEGFHFLGVAHGESDPMFRHDYDERAYRADPQPKSFVEADQQWSNWTLDGLVQPRVNDFYNMVERLPDVKVTGLRQQIGETPVFYESESSVAYLRFQPGLLGGTNFSAFRGDSFQQLLLPQTFFGWLNVTPRVGGRFTHYGEVENVPGITSDRDRWVFQTGMDMSFKVSRVWTDAKSDWLQMDGLRHVAEPTVSYVYTPRPDKTPADLPQFDTDLPSSRLLPLMFPNYSQIDSVDSQNTLRLGLRNSLQTKREGKVETLLYWAAYTDWRLAPNPGQSTFPDFFSDVEFVPQSWLQLSSQLRYDINGHQWRESNSRIVVTPTDAWSWTVGHRYLVDDPLTYGLGNNAFYNSFYFRINEDWGCRTMHQFEGRSGVLQEQQYVVYRDLRSWTAAFVFRLRENTVIGTNNGNTDWTIALMLSLKAFPRYGLGADRDQPNALFGY